MAGAIEWIEDNPLPAGVGIVGGGLVILWLLGFFKSAPATSGPDPNASAYYAAEATQAQFGAAEQVATIQTAAQTAQAKIAADAATSINASNNASTVTQASLLAQSQDLLTTMKTQLGEYQNQSAASIAAYGLEVANNNNFITNSVNQHAADLSATVAQAQIAGQVATAGLGVQLGATQANDALAASISNNNAAVNASPNFASNPLQQFVTGLASMNGIVL
jgi:hypothetical protein